MIGSELLTVCLDGYLSTGFDRFMWLPLSIYYTEDC